MTGKVQDAKAKRAKEAECYKSQLLLYSEQGQYCYNYGVLLLITDDALPCMSLFETI